MIEQHLIEILGKLDVDMFTEKRQGQDAYTVRLWDQGESVITVTRFGLVEAVKVAAEYARGRE